MSTPAFGPARVDELHHAFLTRSVLRPVVRGFESRVRVALGRYPLPADVLRYKVTGAVYANRTLVGESLRPSFLDVSPHDPPVLSRRAQATSHLTGTWLYGGHWMGHFGHFLLETLSTLWPREHDAVEGIVFHLWPSDDYAREPLP